MTWIRRHRSAAQIAGVFALLVISQALDVATTLRPGIHEANPALIAMASHPALFVAFKVLLVPAVGFGLWLLCKRTSRISELIVRYALLFAGLATLAVPVAHNLTL